jgi:hypothetical protein
MILLKPTFDVHIRELNSLKLSILATSERGKLTCRPFFKSNDIYYSINYNKLDEFIDHCEAAGISFYIDDGVRCGDERSEDQ